MNAADRLRLATVALAVLAPAWLLRVVLLARVEGGNAVPLDDAAGFLGDLALSAIVCGLVLAALHRSLALALAVLLPWIAVQLGSYESVRSLDALPSWRDAGYLGDFTFVLGSGAKLLAPGWPPLAALLSLALAFAGRRARATSQQLAAAFVTGALLLGLHASIGWSSGVADWRQTHALIHPFSAVNAPATEVLDPLQRAAIAASLAADLSGSREVGMPAGSPNVLLVLVESISAAYLPSLAAAHHRQAPLAMPLLDDFAQRHRSFSTFVAHQVNTNRGLYAALCGDLPKLLPGTPKMSVLAATGSDACLPALLSQAGYRTAYLQAAPLAFMLKDQFMPRIGFDEVRGDEAFTRASARNAWGVDDGALFEEALALVGRLRAAGRPWFAAVLTVGTHHPYLVPDDFEPTRQDDFERAVLYADRELGRFLAGLESQGVFQDTLVLVTSDESRGRRAEGDAISQLLSQNWGFLVAAGPGIDVALVDDPFGLVDLPVSVLDWLSLPEKALASGLLGRSVFRRYDEPRSVFFANTRRDAVGALAPGGRLELCRRSLQHCETYRVPEGAFADSRRLEAPDEALRDEVVAVARLSLGTGATAQEPDTLELMEGHRIVLPDAGPRLLHGGQNVEIGEDEWIEVEIDATAGRNVGVELRHTLKDERQARLEITRSLAPGNRLRLRYAFVPEPGFERTQCLTVARPLRPRPGTLDFAVARMHIRRDGDRPPAGVTILSDEILPWVPAATSP